MPFQPIVEWCFAVWPCLIDRGTSHDHWSTTNCVNAAHTRQRHKLAEAKRDSWWAAVPCLLGVKHMISYARTIFGAQLSYGACYSTRHVIPSDQQGKVMLPWRWYSTRHVIPCDQQGKVMLPWRWYSTRTETVWVGKRRVLLAKVPGMSIMATIPNWIWSTKIKSCCACGS